MHRTHVFVALSAAFVIGIGHEPGAALAEPPLSIAEPLPSPGRSIVSNDEASAIATNPANLPFMPAPELRWTWLYTQEGSSLPGTGHSFDLAAPLWILGSGLRVEVVDPPALAQEPFDGTYQWVRWGLGVRAGDWLGVGTSMGWSISDNPRLDGQFGMTFGATLRPSPYMATSFVLRDFNVPVSRDDVTESLRSWNVGFAFRPVDGKRDLELGLEASFYDQVTEPQARATLGLDLPYVGRLRADVKAVDFKSFEEAPDVLATAGLDINWGPMQASGGAIFGNAIGLENTGFYAGAAVRGFKEPGIPTPSYVARIDIEDTPGVRGHVRLLRRLWRLAERDDIEGVLLVMKDEPASSLAHAEELGDAIRTLKAHGKKVACHLEDAGGRALFVCSQADRIAMNPAGGLRFSGLSSRYFYLGGLLEKIGVRADFVRIGEHKLAAEQLTLKKGSEVGKIDHQNLVDEYEDIYLHDVGGGRRIARTKLKETLAKGPFLAKEAREAGLIDTLAYPDELDRFVRELMGRPTLVLKSQPFSNAPETWTDGSKIAVVYLAGDMIDGESMNIPIIGIRLAGSKTIADALKKARTDASVKAVIFRIETGGGSSLAADVILREAMLTAREKPFIVSMGSSAASGGYYAAVGSKTIFANRATVTGSIGIFYGKVDVTGLLGKLGVSTEAFRSSPRADAETFFRAFTDDEREELGRKVKQFYDLFIGRVAEGRGMKPAEVDAIARGRVWTGRQAHDRKLVDRLGGMREALEEARSVADLDSDTPIIELPVEDDSLLGFLLSLVGFSANGIGFPVPPALVDVARVLAPFVVYDEGRPLARVEVFEESGFDLTGAIKDDDAFTEEDE